MFSAPHTSLRHRPLAADSAIKALGEERPPRLVVVVASLWYPQVNLAQPVMEIFWLESLGAALTVSYSLMGLSFQRLLPLDLHGDVHDDAKGRSHGRWDLLQSRLP
jgi:hypothetical protein